MIPFAKMQGLGNDFVVLDALRDSLPSDLPEFARRACDRRLGIGGDGVLTLEPGDQSQFRMQMFNPDGSESEMCGNGIRCIGAMIRHRNYAPQEVTTFKVMTGAGVLSVSVLDEVNVRVDMGKYDLDPAAIGLQWTGERFVNELVSKSVRGTAISMGNPHLVIFTEDVAGVDLEHVGPIFETHPWFANRTNVHFVQVLSPTHLRQRTWERGAGITLACGTGACASAVAALLNNRATRDVEVELPGGKLSVEVCNDQSVYMTGPAEFVFEGEF